MPTAIRNILLGSLLLVVQLVHADDQLPHLPSPGSSPESVASFPDQTLSATCYLGNPNDSQTLGEITVNSPRDAGPTCNSMFYDCKGRCYGCYTDFDMSQDICVDNSGRRFLR